jgi:hypothetical protein
VTSLGLGFVLATVGCSGDALSRNGRRGPAGLYDGGLGNLSYDLTPLDPNGDYDGDGYTPNQGDCNDWDPRIGPGAIEVRGDGVDNNCNGLVDEDISNCASGLAGKKDADSIAKSMGICDDTFLLSSTFKGPSDPVARALLNSFGILKPKEGENMILISNGHAADKENGVPYKPQPGTGLGFMNTYKNPEPNLPAVMGCGQMQPALVNDYTELVLKLKAPTNANSFSFDFQFFSAEYPEWVCSQFNDEFLVEMDSPKEFSQPTNISFDDQKNPITVNNGFFTVCKNGTTPQTQHCKRPVSEIAMTGYDATDGGTDPVGGSTGWLTTTAPVTPGEEFTLRFIIFDEGDHILDSAALIDNFRWSAQAVDQPTTIQ